MEGYGLRYRMAFDSVEGHEYVVEVWKRDYDGEVSVRSLGGAPVLRMDDGDWVRGTSLELQVEAVRDGELKELYTTDNKLFGVVLRRDGAVWWEGFVLPELYAEPYVAVPYDVAVTASDGLGVLKGVAYEQGGTWRTLHEILAYCLGMTGLELEVRYASTLYAEGMDRGRDVYHQAGVHVGTFGGKDCYEVLEEVLESTGAYVAQKGGEWQVVRYTDREAPLSGREPLVLTLGGGGDAVYPLGGALDMEVEPGKRSVVMRQPYVLRPSFLDNHDFREAGLHWEKLGDCYFGMLEDKYYCRLNRVADGATRSSIRGSVFVKASAVPATITFEYAVCFSLTANYSPDENTEREFELEVSLGRDGKYSYLSREGWKPERQVIKVKATVQEGKLYQGAGRRELFRYPDSFEKFTINLETIPGDGYLSLTIRNPYDYTAPPAPIPPAWWKYNYVFVRDVVVTHVVEGNGEVELVMNEDASEDDDGLDVVFVDVPFEDNAGLVFYNGLVSGARNTSRWTCEGLKWGSFGDVALQSRASVSGVAKVLLRGTIRGGLDFDLLLDKFSGRVMYVREFTHDLLEDEMEVVLCECVGAVPSAGVVLKGARTPNVAKTEKRVSSGGEHRVFSKAGGGQLTEPRMIRELPEAGVLTKGHELEVDDGVLGSSGRMSLGRLLEFLGDSLWTNEDLKVEDGYLTVRGEKVKAGDSDLWAGHAWEGWMDQPVRMGDVVRFLGVRFGAYVAGESGGMIDGSGAGDLDRLRVRRELVGDEFTSHAFTSGMLGSGHRIKDGNGELQNLTVRGRFSVFELLVQQVRSVGGVLVVSPASMKVIAVEETVDGYRCFFDAAGGRVANPFEAGDQAFRQVFGGRNVVRYWRLVTGVGDDYIELSKADCEAGSGVPSAGDEVVLLGNRGDRARQGAIVISAYDKGSPYIAYYSGIDSFSLAGKEVMREGNLEGVVDADFGPLEGEGMYAKNVYLKGALRLSSSGRRVEDEIRDEANGAAEEAVGNIKVGTRNLLLKSGVELSSSVYVMGMYDYSVELELGKEYTLVACYSLAEENESIGAYYNGGNHPAVYFETHGSKIVEAKSFVVRNTDSWRGDMIFYQMPSGVYAGSKVHWAVLVEGNKAPIDWVAAPEDVAAEIDKVAGELAENVEFVTQVADGLEEVRKQVDGAIETWFYEPAPALGNKPAADWTTGALKERHVGDLYYDGGGKAYRFQRAGDGYEWKPIEDTDLAKALADAKRAQDTADGKRRVFVDVPTDASAYDAGDLWVNATYGEYADELLRCKVGKAAGEAWSIGHWERASKYTDDARAEEALAEAAAAKTAAAEAQGAAEDAQGAADKAQASAEEANRLLGDMASDDKLTAQEKQAALKEWEVVVSEYPRNVAAADGYAVARKGYDDAYAALEGYVTPLLAELGVTSDISGAEFRGMFKGYYDARTDLLNGISAKAKELADNAQERADDAVEDAADAKLAADGAMDVAEAAGTRLDNWAGDGVISPVEKQGLRDEAVRIDADMEEVSGGYAKYGLGEPSAFIAAHAGYRGLLERLGASEPEVIGIPGDFAGKQGAYYAARTEALGVIADAAKKAADDAQAAVEGLSVGTRNLITRRHAIITGGADFPEYTGYSSVVNAKGEREVTVECVKEQYTTYFTVYRYRRIEGHLSEKVYEGWYVLSFDYKTDYDGGEFAFDWRSDSSNMAQYSVGIENTNGEWKRGWIVCDFNNDRGFDSNIFFVRLYDAKVGNYIAYRNLKLVRGTKGWDDSEAPEDVAAREEAMQEGLDGVKEDVKKVVDKQFEFGTDIEGLNGKWEQVTTDIGTISGDVTKVKTEVGDLKASATDFLSRLSSTEKTLEGVQTSVSEIKQDAGSLILRVGGAEKKLGEAWEETSAAISVLKDEINLSVKADGVIASINASTEGVAISGEKVEISGQTVFKDGGGNVVNIFGTGNDVFSINNGVFRVDKSGKAVMKDAEVKGAVVAESGKIGAFNINEYGYLYSGSMVMHDQYIRFKTKDESMVASLGYGGESNSSMLKVNLKSVGAAVRCAQFVGNKNTVLLCEKAGKALAVTGESSFDGLVAFSGFRSVSSGVTLNEGDVFVRCVNSSSITVYLPLNPRTGQMLVFSRNGNSVVLNGNGRSIRYGKSTSTTNTMQNAGGCLLMYDGSYWCVMFFATV